MHLHGIYVQYVWVAEAQIVIYWPSARPVITKGFMELPAVNVLYVVCSAFDNNWIELC